MENKKYFIPQIIVDAKEKKQLNILTERYEKLITPGTIKKTMNTIGTKVDEILPENVKILGKK